jgi:hypothetical protein
MNSERHTNMRKLISAALVLIGGLAVWGCSTTEPAPECNVGRGQPYAVYYQLQSDAPSGCTLGAGGGGQFDKLNGLGGVPGTPTPVPGTKDGATYNEWGVEGYYSDIDPNLLLVAVRPAEFETLTAVDAGTDPAAVPAGNALLAEGNWTSSAIPANKQCSVTTTMTASAPFLQDTTTVGGKYVITNFQTYNDPAHEGTQLHAQLTYTDSSNCAGTYEVIGTWPAVACATQADCNPCGTSLCQPSSPTSSYAFGTGIAQDYPVVCQHGYCMVTGTYPVTGTYNPNGSPTLP